MLATVALDVIQLAGCYTLLEQQALDEVLPLCRQRGVRLVLGAPYNSGILATGAKGKTIGHFNYGPAPADIVARVGAMEDLCAAHGVALRAAALQFPMAHPQVEWVITGTNSAERLRDTVQGATAAIPAALWSDLKRAGLIRRDAPVPQS
jgi:D-threo-aldose 1-dehydrogenase